MQCLIFVILYGQNSWLCAQIASLTMFLHQMQLDWHVMDALNLSSKGGTILQTCRPDRTGQLQSRLWSRKALLLVCKGQGSSKGGWQQPARHLLVLSSSALSFYIIAMNINRRPLPSHRSWICTQMPSFYLMSLCTGAVYLNLQLRS